ncbi:MAG: hypothetical protein ACFB21_00795 [Opitutales bacterium]
MAQPSTVPGEHGLSAASMSCAPAEFRRAARDARATAAGGVLVAGMIGFGGATGELDSLDAKHVAAIFLFFSLVVWSHVVRLIKAAKAANPNSQ